MIKTDLCIIGAGSGGLSVAAGAVQMGAKVILIEKNKMGGDCLNYGCIPSKALLSIAKKIYSARGLTEFDLKLDGQLNFDNVKAYIQDVIRAIEPHDSVERFNQLGVDVYLGQAQFIDEQTVEVNSERIRAKRFIVATGSKAMIPPIEGLSDLKFFTNENIFDIPDLPRHLLIIGGGPIGIEMAQAFAMLGSKVSVFDVQNILPKDKPELVQIIRAKLESYGVNFYENIRIFKVFSDEDAQKHIIFEVNQEKCTIEGSHILVAAGRKTNTENFGLDNAKVKYDAKGIHVDMKLRTSNKKIYALGDVINHLQFTHAASYQAGIIIKNILFKIGAKINYSQFPWVTYTSPELAHVGMSADMLEKVPHKLLQIPLKDNDRAQTEKSTIGQVIVAIDKKSKILSVDICAEDAGELLSPWLIAMQNNLSIKSVAQSVFPYPTKNEINKRIAGSYFLPMLTSKKTQAVVKFLLKYFTP